MNSWQVLFREDKAGKNSGGGSADQDFNDAEDDALVEEGETLLEEETADEESESGDEEEHSEEEQDDPEEEEEVESGEEEASGFRFKDPKTGNFDFKRINKAVGGPELEKAFKEQSATITRTSQENKALKDQLGSPGFVEGQKKAGFFDHLMATHPGIRAEVLKVLHGDSHAGQGQQNSGTLEIPGLAEGDPVGPVLQKLYGMVNALQNRQQEGVRQQQESEHRGNFVNGLRQAGARFKELVGREPTEDEMRLVASEMQDSGHLNGSRFVADLFYGEIQAAARKKFLDERKVKQKLPKTGHMGRRAPEKTKKKSREDAFRDDWDEHMGGES